MLQQSATGPYFLGDQYSLADIAIAPFILRINAFRKVALKGFEFDAVKANSRLAEFIEGISSRPTVQETYVGDKVFLEVMAKRFNIKF